MRQSGGPLQADGPSLDQAGSTPSQPGSISLNSAAGSRRSQSRYGGVPAAARSREREGGKWTKQAADEPDSHGVEWLRYKDRYGSCVPWANGTVIP